jgi:hypothetical protein
MERGDRLFFPTDPTMLTLRPLRRCRRASATSLVSWARPGLQPRHRIVVDLPDHHLRQWASPLSDITKSSGRRCHAQLEDRESVLGQDPGNIEARLGLADMVVPGRA